MREIFLEESKQIQMKILKSIDSFCRKNGINYSLAGGSLIGAVRHKGFIPWDDDIDLMMMRDDYNKFVSIYTDEIFKVLSHRRINTWPHLYCSVVDPRTEVLYHGEKKSKRGVWVSIFPIDRIPDDNNVVNKMIRDVQKISGSMIRIKKSYWTPNTNFMYNLAKAIGRIVLSPFPVSIWCNKIERIIISHNNEPTKRYSSSAEWAFGTIFNFSADSFDGYVDLDFEDMKCMCCAGYDDYLRGQYGDYMQLPPEEARVPKHDFKAYWKR